MDAGKMTIQKIQKRRKITENDWIVSKMVTEIVNIKLGKITQIFNCTSLHKAIQMIKITMIIF